MLKPVSRANLSDQVFEQLRDRILNEEYAPGDRLPSERELCEHLQVNRSSVREALKRLEHVRLIATRQGGGSHVLDFRTHGGLDLLRDLVAPGGRVEPYAARSLFELAAGVWPEMARHCASRASASDLSELATLVDRIEDLRPGDAAQLQDLDLAFFYLLARSSENVAFMLVMNTVRSVYDQYRQIFTHMYRPAGRRRSNRYRRLFEAIQSRDSARAARLCRQLLDEHAEAFRNKE